MRERGVSWPAIFGCRRRADQRGPGLALPCDSGTRL